MHRILLALSLLASLLCAACGSSGGGSSITSATGLPDPNALFAGDYGMTWIEGRPDVPDLVRARWGTISGDGMGTAFFDQQFNADGSILVPPPSDVDFQVHLDRELEIGQVVPGTSLYRGAISETGDVFLFGASVPAFLPGLAIGTRRSGLHDAASLSDSYFFISYSAFAGAGFNVAGWGTVSFDGAGGASFSTNQNFEGALAGPVVAAATYSVAADGQFLLTLAGGLELAGSIGAGGELLTAGGGVLAGDDPTAYVFVRRGMGFADTDLDGQWHMAGFTHEFLPNDYSSMLGGARKEEGNPDFGFIGLLNKNGNMEGIPFSMGPISIDAGGNVELELSPGVFLHGGMSSDRRFMILGGMDQPGSDPTISFLMR